MQDYDNAEALIIPGGYQVKGPPPEPKEISAHNSPNRTLVEKNNNTSFKD